MFLQITFKYPLEYITRVVGCYRVDYSRGSNYLCSIIFYTNKGKYGPYGPGVSLDNYDLIDYQDGIVLNDFDYKIVGKFWGFFGTYKSNGIESIGLYEASPAR